MVYNEFENDDDLFEEFEDDLTEEELDTSEPLNGPNKVAYGHPLDGKTHCRKCDRVHLEYFGGLGNHQVMLFANKIGKDSIQEFLDMVDEVGHLQLSMIVSTGFHDVVNEKKDNTPFAAFMFGVMTLMMDSWGDKVQAYTHKHKLEASIYALYESMRLLQDSVELATNNKADGFSKIQQSIVAIAEHQASILTKKLDKEKARYYEFCEANEIAPNEGLVENDPDTLNFYKTFLKEHS